MRSSLCYALFVLVLIGGCSRPNAPFVTVGNKVGGGPNDEAKAPANAPPEKNDEFVALQDPEVKGEPKAKAPKLRKIRYTSDQSIIVEDFDKAVDGLQTAMKDAQAEMAQEEIRTTPGQPRSGTWRIRVPVDQLSVFRSKIIALGEAERNTLQSEDLTAQYYDLEAHITNRNAEREALRDLLKEVGKKDIKHYLEIKRELDSLTDDINRKEGQLRLWKNLTDLTTCTVQLREKQRYIAEEKAKDQEEPTFGMRIGKTWSDSGEKFIEFCQGLVLVAIAIIPWLPIPLIVGLFFWGLARFTKRSHPVPPTVVEVEPVPEAQEKGNS
jgi:hypothetical protein